MLPRACLLSLTYRLRLGMTRGNPQIRMFCPTVRRTRPLHLRYELTRATVASSPSAHAETPVSASIIARPPLPLSAKRTQRQAEIAYQIKLLEAQMQALLADPTDDSAPETGAAPAVVDTAHDSALQAEIQVLRDEVASLRTRWELEQRRTTAEIPASEAPPRYSRGS